MVMKWRSLAAVWVSAIVSGLVASQEPGPEWHRELQVTVRIPPQPMRAALRAFAEQTHLQVVYRTEQIGPRLVCAEVSGTYPAEEALGRLLGSSGLRALRINARTLAVRAAKPQGNAVRAAAPHSDPKGRE